MKKKCQYLVQNGQFHHKMSIFGLGPPEFVRFLQRIGHKMTKFVTKRKKKLLDLSKMCKKSVNIGRFLQRIGHKMAKFVKKRKKNFC